MMQTSEQASVLDMRGASVVRGGQRVVTDLSLQIGAGEHVAVLGPNGAGKSTLINLILKQIHPLHGGQVCLWGCERWDLFELRRQMGFVSPALQRDLTGEDALQVLDAVVSGFFASRGLWHHHQVSADMMQAAQQALERAGVAHLSGRRMDSLSTGEARRVLIARALVHGPKALLLDEACAGLDPAARRAFLNDLRGVLGPDVTLIMVTHHVEEILPEIKRVVMLKDGRIIQDMKKADALTDEALSALFGIEAQVTAKDGWFSVAYG